MTEEEREKRREFLKEWRKKRMARLDERVADNMREVKRLNKQLRVLEIMRRFR